MATKKESAALTEKNNAGFAALADKNFAAKAREELDGLGLTFERVKIPAGASTAFELPTEGEETETAKEFPAVILYHHPLNAYYESKYAGGSNPPDCGSFDGKTGTGGKDCATCPHNRFGTGENGAKACKNKRRVYILREGECFPLLLTLPTGSLRAFAKYLKTQLAKRRTSSSVITRFSLKKATSGGGIAFSQAAFAFERALTSEELALIKPLSEEMKTYAAQVGFDAALPEDDAVPDNIDPETGEIIEPIEPLGGR
jgi:hypothetical protein